MLSPCGCGEEEGNGDEDIAAEIAPWIKAVSFWTFGSEKKNT